jgi:hypothetical protein
MSSPFFLIVSCYPQFRGDENYSRFLMAMITSIETPNIPVTFTSRHNPERIISGRVKVCPDYACKCLLTW